MSAQRHKKNAPKTVALGILTVSTTRTLADDKSGQWISEQAVKAGHKIVDHQVIKDDADIIVSTVQKVIEAKRPQVLLVTGGTGITFADVTIEAIKPLFTKELTAFGSLFAGLSMDEIGSAAILSRATAGVIGPAVVFCMPGSLNACKLACTELIFPELGHLAKHMQD
jgi:molybdenum cofactor biosynthesis protein B